MGYQCKGKTTLSILAIVFACVCFIALTYNPQAFADEFQAKGFEPVYANSLDDNNHADQVPETLKNLLTHDNKTYVVESSDGRFIDVSLSFLKGREIFNAQYESTTDARQKEALSFFSEGLWNYDARITDTSTSHSTRHGFTMIEHANTHRVSFTTGMFFSFPITEDDVLHIFNSTYGYNKKSSEYTGANLMTTFRVVEVRKQDGAWGNMMYNYYPDKIGASYDLGPVSMRTAEELRPYQVFWENEKLQSEFQHVFYFRVNIPKSTDEVKYSHVDLTTSLSYITNTGNSASADYAYNEFDKTIKWNVQNKLLTSSSTTTPLGDPEALYVTMSSSNNYANFHKAADPAYRDLTYLNTDNLYSYNMSEEEYGAFVSKSLPGYLLVSTTIPTEQKGFYLAEAYSTTEGNKFVFDYERVYRKVPAALAATVVRSEKAPEDTTEPAVENPVAIPHVKLEVWNADHTQSLGIMGETDQNGTIHFYKADPASITEDALKDLSQVGAGDELGKIDMATDGVLLNPGAYSLKITAVPEEAGFVMPTNAFVDFTLPESSDTSVHESLVNIYLQQKHTVSFDTQGGSDVADVQVMHKDTLDASSVLPTREGYTFKGWFEDKELSVPYEIKSITEDMTLYAKWDKIQTHTIHFETFGGSKVDDVVVIHGDNFDASDIQSTRFGFTFKGWFEDEKLTVPYTAKSITEDMTLYAKWEIYNPFKPGGDPEPDNGAGNQTESVVPNTSDSDVLSIVSVLAVLSLVTLVVARKGRKNTH